MSCSHGGCDKSQKFDLVEGKYILVSDSVARIPPLLGGWFKRTFVYGLNPIHYGCVDVCVCLYI